MSINNIGYASNYSYDPSTKKLITNSQSEEEEAFCRYFNNELQQGEKVTNQDAEKKREIISFLSFVKNNANYWLKQNMLNDGKTEEEFETAWNEWIQKGNYEISYEKSDTLTSKINTGEFTMIAQTIIEFTEEEQAEAGKLSSDYTFQGEPGFFEDENKINLCEGSVIKLNDNYYLQVTKNGVEVCKRSDRTAEGNEVDLMKELAEALNKFIRYANNQVSYEVFDEKSNKNMQYLLKSLGINLKDKFYVNDKKMKIEENKIVKENYGHLSYLGMPDHVIQKAMARYEETYLNAIREVP